MKAAHTYMIHALDRDRSCLLSSIAAAFYFIQSRDYAKAINAYQMALLCTVSPFLPSRPPRRPRLGPRGHCLLLLQAEQLQEGLPGAGPRSPVGSRQRRSPRDEGRAPAHRRGPLSEGARDRLAADDPAAVPRESEPPASAELHRRSHVLAMVADSTNVFVENDILSESDVKDSLTTLFSRYSGKRLVVTCFASNVGRIESIAEAAEKNGRTVCLLGRSLWRVEGAGRACGYFRGINVFLTDEEAQDLPPSKVLYLCTGCQGEPKAALSNLSYGVYRSLQLNKGDVVIFSSRVIPGNEQAIANIKNRFIAKGIEVVTDKDALTHVSGHANHNDMKRMYGFVRPKIAVPVHGEAAHLFEHAKLADECGISQTVIPKDGDVISFGADKAEVIGSVQSGLMAMDGRKIIPVNADVLKKRRRMLEDGTVVATVVLDKKNTVVGSVQISATGLIDAQSPEMSVLDEGIKAALSSLTPARLKDDGSVADAVKAAIRKTVMENHGRRPMVDVHLVRV